MKRLSRLVGLCITCLITHAALAGPTQAPPPAPPVTLKLPDLANRPDRWPESVTLKKDLTFGPDQSFKAGTQLHVLDFNGQQLVVDGGNNTAYPVAPADCDLLEAANKIWSKLSVAQRRIEPEMLEKDPSLWPLKVKCFSSFRLEGGKEIPAGSEFDLVTLSGQGARLFHRESGTHLMAKLAQTDTIARARERVLLDPAKRPSRIVEALRDVMVGADGKPFTKDKLDDTRIFALYFGASWCGPCRQFSPTFVKFVNDNAAQNPKLTVVMISNDKDEAAMLKYMTDEKMPWPAVSFAALNKAPVFVGYQGNGIPQLVLLDRHGKVLADSFENGQYVGPLPVMQQLAKMLGKGQGK